MRRDFLTVAVLAFSVLGCSSPATHGWRGEIETPVVSASVIYVKELTADTVEAEVIYVHELKTRKTTHDDD